MGSEGYGSSSLYGLGAGVVDMDGVRGDGIFVEMGEWAQRGGRVRNWGYFSLYLLSIDVSKLTVKERKAFSSFHLFQMHETLDIEVFHEEIKQI